MDGSTEEILLQKIEELIIDEDKIVTNSIVCEKFDLSLTDSKRILEKYVSDENLNPGKVSVTYVICGKLKSGVYCIQIIDSIELKEKRKLFSSISNEVVYSIQKHNTIDLNTIALSQKSGTTRKTAPKGSIVGEKCTERLIKSKALPPPPPQKNFEKQKPSSFFKPTVKLETNCEKKSSQSTPTNGTQNKTENQKKAGGLAGFLSQTSNNESKQQFKKILSSDEDNRERKRPKLEINDVEPGIVDVKVENEPEPNEMKNGDTKPQNDKKSEMNSETSNNKRTSKNANNKKKQDGKKRKRIIVESESEDDLFAKDEEEEKMDLDLEEEKPPVITQSKEVIPRNKTRKAVENVYTDDEGFIVTKTEFVLVSASEDDEAEVNDEKPKYKPEVKLATKDCKKSPPQKAPAKGKKGKTMAVNQPTLMNFFKKK